MEATTQAPDAARAELSFRQLIELAQKHARQGETTAALEHFERAFVRAAAEGTAADVARLLRWIGNVRRERGENDVALELYEASLAIAQVNGLVEDVASAYNCMGIVQQFAGAPDHAESLYREARRMALTAGNDGMIAMMDNNLGMLASMRGDQPAALLSYTSALFRYRRLGDQYAATRALTNMGLSHVRLGELEAAEACFDQAHELANRTRDQHVIGFIQLNRAELLLKRQHYEAARQCCDEGFSIFSAQESKTGLGLAYKLYGVLYRETGKTHLADIHLGLAWSLACEANHVVLQAEVQHELARVHLEEQRNRDAIACLNLAHSLFREVQARGELLSIDQLLDELEGTYLHVVERWGSDAIESKDPYTAGHSQRVADYSTALARAAGIEGRELTWLRIGAFLHDVGKTVVPAGVLGKPGVLNQSEWAMMKRHTVVGDEIVASLQLPHDIRPMVRNHHERWDGEGYPDRLAGTAIPLPARILAVADVYDALTTARSYRNPFPVPEARRILDHQAGRALDPELVALFQQVV